jgi:hypothetical protein
MDWIKVGVLKLHVRLTMEFRVLIGNLVNGTTMNLHVSSFYDFGYMMLDTEAKMFVTPVGMG